MAYTFDAIFAADPSNPANIAANASIIIFDPADTGRAPITITDPTDSPISNPITVNKNGFGPSFKHATLDRVGWAGGGFEGFLTSYEGIKNEALAAREAAETAVSEAMAASAAATAASNSAGGFPASQGITYNPDGTVSTVTEDGVTTSYTYNPDGTVATDSRQGITRTYTYTNGNLTGIEAA